MGEETQVLVRFTTRLPPELQVPATEVAVPASLKRYGLSQIINHLLALDPARPFDFIIDGELLRKSLQQHLLEHDISPELVVEVEYVPAVVPPEPKAALPQDDWVTAVAAVASGSTLASGAADGVLRLWTGAGDCVLEFSAHKQGVNALASLAAAAAGQQQQQPSLLLSAGKDHAVRLWQLSAGSSSQQQQQQQHAGKASKASSSSSSSNTSAHCAVVYKGHKEAIQCVTVNPGADMCCSGGWDGQLLLWRTGQQVLDEAANGTTPDDAEDAAAAAGTRKKRKVGSAAANGTAAAAAAAIELAAVAALPGHVHCISALSWPESGTVYSGGWDHSVRRHDVETRTNTDTYNGSKAVYAVAAPAAVDAETDSSSSSSSNVVAFGGADRVLRIWDTRRVKGEGLAVKAYNAHEGWISSIAWRPGSAYQLATGGHDGSVKVWDVRSGVPLGSLVQHDQKVLCVGWWGAQQLVSGGADCKLQLYDMP